MRAPPAPPGFTGKRGAVVGSASDGAHHVTIANYSFPDGSTIPYVELHEDMDHDGARAGRVMAISTLVHLAQNASENEVFEIGNRKAPGGNELARRIAVRISAMYADTLTSAGDGYIFVAYGAKDGDGHRLTIGQAQRYLAWLENGGRGTHVDAGVEP